MHHFRRVVSGLFLTLIILTLLTHFTFAQERVITAGFQFKPIFSSKFFNTGPESTVNEGVNFKITPQSGYCMGMVIRKGLSNTVSLESGINYVRRNYNLNISDTTPGVDEDFKIVGYEIPVQALVFIRLSDFIYMDVAMGASMDFYPSDVRTESDLHEQYSVRNTWFSPSVLANIGWEYRTEKSGFVYLGASYHRPFNTIFYTYAGYPDLNVLNPVQTKPAIELSGNYLTFDLRYYFHSDPERRKKKTK